MKSITETITDICLQLDKDIQLLFFEHSSIKVQPELPGVSRHPYKFEPLSISAKRLQSKIFKDFKYLCQILHILLDEQDWFLKEDFLDAENKIPGLLMQTSGTYRADINEAYTEVQSLLQQLISNVQLLHDNSEGETILVVDTNALLNAPTLEKWHFDNIAQFTILLTPVILKELDSHKVSHPSPSVREKSKKIIRQLKEYIRRGDLTSGVSVVNGKIKLASIGHEPDMSKSLSWLKETNPDDRFIASTIEIMRYKPRSKVIVVTNDINLHNKAHIAKIPVIDPPELVAKK